MKDRERAFVDEYMIDMNATAAALRAGYAPKTAKDASEWIHIEHPTKPKLRAEIDQRIALRSRRLGINADRVLLELAKVAFANPGDVVDMETGEVREDAQPEDLAAITSVRISNGRNPQKEYRMDGKVRALELVAKYIGMTPGGDREKGELSQLDRLMEEFRQAMKAEPPEEDADAS